MLRRILPTVLLAAVAVAAGAGSLPAAAQEPGYGTLTGTVTIAGAAPEGAAACVTILDAGFGPVGQLATDPETHRYETDIPAGDYFLRFDAACTGGGAIPELHPDASRFEDAVPVTVDAGATTTVDAELRRWIPIAGRVADQFGDPVSCSVSTQPVTGYSIANGFGYAYWTDGVFDTSWSGAVPGEQVLHFGCPVGYATPEPRVVTIGDDPSVPFDLGDVVVPLLPGTVSGTLSTEGNNLYPLANACVIATTPSGALLGVTQADANHWAFAGLPAGPIRIAFRDCSRDGRTHDFVAEWYGDAPTIATAREVVVDPAATVAHVDATVTPWARINGGVFDADGRVAGGVCMWVTDVTQTQLVGVAYIPNWFFASVRVLPGEYKVLFTDCGGGWRSVWVGGTDDPTTAQVVTVGADGTSTGAVVTPR